jgi:hypothetical protein
MAVYSLKNLRQMVLAQTDERTDENIARDVVNELINHAHEARCLEYADNFLMWDTKETFTTTAGQHQYSLHQLFDRPVYFYNQTSKVLLSETPRRAINDSGAILSPDITGSARNFALWGHNSVLAQPTSASTLSLVSNNAADTGTDYEIVIKGLNTSNELVAEKVALTGTTPVSSSYTYTKIFSIVKERAMTGQLTVTSNSGAVTILRLSSDEFGRQYRQCWIFETPTTSETIEYRFYRKPSYLVNDYDIPDIPAPYSKLLVFDALLLWGAYNTDTSDKSLTLWKEQQTHWERLLQTYVKEGQSLGAKTRKVREETDFYDLGPDRAR